MKKIKLILLGVMLVHFRAIWAQDCSTTNAESAYTYMEVLNNDNGKFEKFNKVPETHFSVHVNAPEKKITLVDPENNYGGEFFIINCVMLENSLVYDCMDIKNKKVCRLTFSASASEYVLSVEYEIKPIIYRVKRPKTTN